MKEKSVTQLQAEEKRRKDKAKKLEASLKQEKAAIAKVVKDLAAAKKKEAGKKKAAPKKAAVKKVVKPS